MVVSATVIARRLTLIAICALVIAPAARASTTSVTVPAFDGNGHLIATPFAPSPNAAHQTKEHVLAVVKQDPKVAAWLTRYPAEQGMRRAVGAGETEEPLDGDLAREDLARPGRADR